ncbi:MAG TPA: hypothetical protein VJ844_11020 [Mucilaginibacter sp.]|nr:hypothetical protein [Mucilaginibacter sp.]
MKQFFTIILLFVNYCSFGQTDNNGNPVFNSVTTQTETINDYHLLSNYYTLKNNIENKNSSVYIAPQPTLNQVEKAATRLPSDFFIVEKYGVVIALILIRDMSSREFFVTAPATGKQKTYPCSLKGDISENRANEIIREHYDTTARIDGSKSLFNKKEFSIISSSETKKAVLELIDKEKLDRVNGSSVKLLSQDEIKAKILTESKEGGKMDFFTPIKGHEYNAVQIKPRLIATMIELALYKWGRTAYDLGVNKIEDALAIWAEFKGRPANSRESTMITQGFNRELEK